jgi:hypothetical protein
MGHTEEQKKSAVSVLREPLLSENKHPGAGEVQIWYIARLSGRDEAWHFLSSCISAPPQTSIVRHK